MNFKVSDLCVLDSTTFILFWRIRGYRAPSESNNLTDLSPIQYNKIQQTEKVVDNGKADQWLDIAALEAGVCHTRQDPMCRLCKEALTQNGIHPLGLLRMTKLKFCWTSRARQTNWRWPTNAHSCGEQAQAMCSDKCSYAKWKQHQEHGKLEKYQGLREKLE